MSNELAKVFTDTNVSVRTVVDAVGEVWFGCTDVAKAVGYENAANAVSTLMLDRKELSEIEPPPINWRGRFFGCVWQPVEAGKSHQLGNAE